MPQRVTLGAEGTRLRRGKEQRDHSQNSPKSLSTAALMSSPSLVTRQASRKTDTEIKAKADEIEYHVDYGFNKKDLQKGSGINGESGLSVIGSINYSKSFPLDLMHVPFENILPQLLSMWGGTYKGAMITGQKSGKLKNEWVLSSSDWHDINNDVLSSNSIIPAQLARMMGSVNARGYWTANTYAHFMKFLGPIVLKGGLPDRYYKNFVLLSETVKVLIGMDMKKCKLAALGTALVIWVRDFERGWVKAMASDK
ncbi:hypothetical protein QFC21_002221 [Naganishia friedmannii]|uniref:Uncharacterized protein n=1 Tax=Naganishia friedmannii TaxID=89922 RepID=A0ACC2VXG0_9TREE|nr:hypothetical protein QFC21_002221 [Naganishia friedmannii]